MTPRRIVVLLVGALVGYFGLIGYRGIYLLSQPGLGAKVFGIAVLVLPLVGIWVVVAELRFGFATERLGRELGSAGAVDEEVVPRLPSGRVDRAAADRLFDQQRRQVEAAPSNWRAWYRLALAYDLAGDRRRARAAMRTAIERADG